MFPNQLKSDTLDRLRKVDLLYSLKNIACVKIQGQRARVVIKDMKMILSHIRGSNVPQR